ncbi:hypothetical protein, partial [Ensifer adhaerens]|uniref:hypothetical protein n=1 Tax=Ensifer adhaerens TaxID=106592 RepID=UPI001AEF2F3D
TRAAWRNNDGSLKCESIGPPTISWSFRNTPPAIRAAHGAAFSFEDFGGLVSSKILKALFGIPCVICEPDSQ